MAADARGSGRARSLWRGARRLAGALRLEDLRLRAMSLTYISIFAIVPGLVVAFSVVQSFTGADAVSRRLHGFLLENLAVGAQESIEPYLEQFVHNAHTTSAGVVGGLLLLLSAVSLFGNVEGAFNEIWTVRRSRPLLQRVLVYWAGLTLAPVLLTGSLGLAHAVGSFLAGESVNRVLARVAAAILSCTLFGALYLIVPAARVRVQAAAAGGLVAGVTWELAKAGYTFAVERFFRFHAVYGSVAAIAIFLIWLEVSWTLVLLGAKVSFVVQHARALLRGHAPEGEGTPLGRELLAARVMLEVALAFRDGRPPPNPELLALRMGTFGEPVRDVLGTLRTSGLVLDSARGFVPARPLDALTLADVRKAIAGDPPLLTGHPAEALVSGILGAAEGAATDALAGRSYAELCDRLAPRTPRARGGAALDGPGEPVETR